MASATKTVTITQKRALERVSADLDRLSSLQANVIKMRHGVTERRSASVGKPAKGVSEETAKKLQAIEAEILDRARGKNLDDPQAKVKEKIVKILRKGKE